MDAIICTDRDEFDALNIQVWASLKATAGAQGAQWTSAIVHPETGEIAFPIEDRIMDFLTTGQKARVETLTPDWFPAEPVEG